MSLQDILDAIHAEDEAQVLEIERRACSEASQILTAARMQADTIFERASAETFSPAEQERARILHRARLDALCQIGNAREALINATLDQTRGHLSGLRGDKEYSQVFTHLVEEAFSALTLSENGAAKVYIQADPCDRATLEALLEELEWEAPVVYDMECWGGVVARTEDECVVVINTLEARLEKATPYLRRYLAVLFEDELVKIKADERSQEVLVQ